MKLSDLWHSRTHSTSLPDRFTRPGAGEFEAVAEYYDQLMAAVPYQSWVDYVEELLRRHRRRPRLVLDLACGTGKVGSEFLRRGYQAVGLDLSEPMVQGCARQDPPLPAAVMDAQTLTLRPGSVDLIVSLYDSLNYVLDPDGLQRCFAGAYAGLRDQGLLIFDLNTALALRAGLFTQNNLHSASRLKYSWRSHWYPERKLCRIDMWFRWEGAGGRREFREVHYERAYSQREVKQMLAAAGFADVFVYSAYTCHPPGPAADRVFYVAEK